MDKEAILVIMAAGIGSRYGGPKQIDSIGPNGEILMEYSVYDAIRAGFKRFIFIVGKQAELFEKTIRSRIQTDAEISFAIQDLEDLPEGFTVPEGRVKPWGTSHAILAARELIDAPFAVINADDFYGLDAFKLAYEYLSSGTNPQEALLVNYVLGNTLSEHGYVSRGICKINEDKELLDIEELLRVVDQGEYAEFSKDNGETWTKIAKDTPCSMNFWAFNPEFMAALVEGFPLFLEKKLSDNPMKCEYLLPVRVGELIREQKLRVICRQSEDRWFGVTYKEDKEIVLKELEQMIAEGKYPQNLWS